MFWVQLLIFLIHSSTCIGQSFPAYQAQCLPGWEQDGSCSSALKPICIDPREVCMQGICCQPSRNAIPSNPYMPCPIGTFQQGTCQLTGFCFNPRETCIQGACCRPDENIQFYGQGGGFYPGYGGGGYGFGCMDFDATCPYYRSYCFSQAIVEACMMSCGICGGFGGYGTLGGGYGYGGLGGAYGGGYGGYGYNNNGFGGGGGLLGGGGLGGLLGRKK